MLTIRSFPPPNCSIIFDDPDLVRSLKVILSTDRVRQKVSYIVSAIARNFNAKFYTLIYLFISALTSTTPATQIKTTKCQPRIERLQKEH